MTEWEYTNVSGNAADRDSYYDVLRKMGRDGWEAWHLIKKPDGWWEVFFKRPATVPGSAGAGAPAEISPDLYRAVLSVLEDLEGEVSRAFLAKEVCLAVIRAGCSSP